MNEPRFRPVFIEERITNFIVSDNGSVYNSKTKKYLTKSVGKDGYLYVHIRCRPDGIDSVVAVHRLVANAFVDGDKSLSVDHIDGDKTNNLHTNLQYMDIVDNIKKYHIQKFYKQNYSKNNNKTNRRSNVFDEHDVRVIRRDYSDGKTIREIATDFNEGYNTIYAVVKNKVHKYVI